ncbi:hypothetical protein GGR55DRAFT_345715 [Xylaria sp. FL0064]|nr:hypothetical protein GGR55DRAFT_345715 [Xylaria sp. FL0064]
MVFFEVFIWLYKFLALLFAIGIYQHLLSCSALSTWAIFGFLGLSISILLAYLALIGYRNKQWGKPLPYASSSSSYGVVRVSIQLSRPLKVDAGQYILLWMPIDVWSVFQTHPFVITSWAEVYQTTLDLYIQPRGGFTLRLFRRCQRDETKAVRRRVLISGPHGVSEPVWDYASVLMIATGPGIAAMLPYLTKVIYGYRAGRGRTRRLHLVWQLQNFKLLNAARQLLNSALDHDSLGDGKILQISIYCMESQETQLFGRRATLFHGAPNYQTVIENELKRDYEIYIPESDQGALPVARLESKLERKQGDMLVLISGTNKVKDKVMDLMRPHLANNVSVRALDYQPE